MSDFNVFDEWGNYVGRFTPSGKGTADSIIMFFAVIILWTIGFLVYLFIKLVVEGFRAAAEGNWGKAVLNWAIPVLLLVGPVFVSTVEARTKQVAQENREAEIQWATQNPLQAIEFIRVRGSVPGTELPDCSTPGCGTGGYYDDPFTFGEYRLTNNLQLNVVYVFSPYGLDEKCVWDFAHRVVKRVSPGEAITFYCIETASWDFTSECIEARSVLDWPPEQGRLIARYCLDKNVGALLPTRR